AAPWSFLLAGLAAALTGLCYAELGSRFPDAAGAVAYVRNAFDSAALPRITGAVTTLVVAISAASIARGAVIYLAVLVPLPAAWLGAALIVGFTIVAAIGIRESVGIAAAVGAIEIFGVIAAAAVGWWSASDAGARVAAMTPGDLSAWSGVASG